MQANNQEKNTCNAEINAYVCKERCCPSKSKPHKPHRLAYWAGGHEHSCKRPCKSCFAGFLIFCFIVSYKYCKVQCQQKCNCNNYRYIQGLGCLVEFHECGKEETRGY